MNILDKSGGDIAAELRDAHPEILVRRGTNSNKHIHLPAGDGCEHVCGRDASSKPHRTLERKNRAIWPAGHLPWCRYCAAEWLSLPVAWLPERIHPDCDQTVRERAQIRSDEVWLSVCGERWHASRRCLGMGSDSSFERVAVDEARQQAPPCEHCAIPPHASDDDADVFQEVLGR